MQHIALLTLVVRDYDEAVAFYTGALGFDLVEDSDRGDGSRWVVVRPPRAPPGPGGRRGRPEDGEHRPPGGGPPGG
ncbi:VOC family protein, partial [Streptomyces chryseus]